ncbi:MAG: hypothetical protein KAI45_13300, partial [Melioribacteraceae bacterium]|nr:hypothetical protein [Melioribacteraceae bacterium]
YIIQAISVASNNLRLSSDKIETVAILKEHFEKCEQFENQIKKMKTKTELSKFAIKLWESFQFVSSSHLDFLKVTDVFKEHSHNLVIELSNLLDIISPEKLREMLSTMEGEREISVTLESGKIKTEIPTEAEIRKIVAIDEETSKESAERDELKEELILGGLQNSNSFDFNDFEEVILKPISKLELLLKKMLTDTTIGINYSSYISLMKKNADISTEIGFTILADMYTIFYTAFTLIESKRLEVDKNLIESLRACLIVIVAVVRGKDVDITNYLNKAENLGKFLKLN